jgi:hypothetical protein
MTDAEFEAMSGVYDALVRAMGDLPVDMKFGEAGSNSLRACMNGMKAIFDEDNYRQWLQRCQAIGALV